MDESKTSEGGERVGNLAEPMEGVEGGNTSEDVMIEVLGSDVFVDGVRSHEDDDKIDAVVSEDEKPGDNNKTAGDDMDIDSKLSNDLREPLGVGDDSKDTALVKDDEDSETEVDTGEKEIPDEKCGLVAESSIIVVEETQLIDDDNDGGLVEETKVVVDDKNLINETNDEVENPLEDHDVSHQGKTEVFVETVVDASSGGPVESSRPTGGSTTLVQEQDGSESAAADTIVTAVEQDTPLTTQLVPNQEGEEQENVNVVNGVECHPSLVLETPSSLGEDNLNPEDDSVDVSPIPEESAAVMQSKGEQADVSVLEDKVNTEEPSLELLASGSAEGDVEKIKEDTEGSSVVAVFNEEIQTKDKPQVEGTSCSIEEADDGLAADSEQPTQIVAARKTEEVGEETISSTCPIDQDSKPEEGHPDSKMDDCADDVDAASLTGQTTEANMEVVTSSSEKVEQTQEAIEQEKEKKPPLKGSLKHHLNDITYPIKKGTSMEELMSKTTNTNDDDQRSTKAVMNGTTAAPQVLKRSFKIGECISRVASQLTGFSALPKQQHADPEDALARNTNEKKHSLHDLLSRLQVAAQEPLKEHTNDNDNSSFDVIINFFSDFRNSSVLEQNPELAKMGGGGGGGSGSKRKRPSHLDDGSTEAFEFEDMNDSYWTDRVIENGVEEELLPSDGSGAVAITTAKRPENYIVSVEMKHFKTGRRPYKKRRHLETAIAEKPDYIDPNAPAELVMIFSEFGFIPATEVSLNRMFKRFGPLRESQTELNRDSCCARVVFKRRSDAEVACSSAGRFNIFGPVHVIYQLNYTVSSEIKTTDMIKDGGGHQEEDCIE